MNCIQECFIAIGYGIFAKKFPEQSKLLRDFDPDKMHCAGYKLSVGDEYFLGDQHYYLPTYSSAPEGQKRNWVEIPPFQVAVLKTQEILCLPRFLIARWNLVVKLAYRGLLWVGAAQVDPGYVGHLFCPIYNLSDRHVRLDEGDDIALIDFVVTTPFPYKDCKEEKKWIRQPLTDKPIIDDYVQDGLRSALFTDVAERVNVMESMVRELDLKTSFSTQITIAALAVIPALIVTMLPFGGAATITASLWGPAAVGLSVFAVGVVIFNALSNYLMVRSRLLRERFGLWIQPRVDGLGTEARSRVRRAVILFYGGMHLLATAMALAAAVWLGKWVFERAHEDTANYIRAVAMGDSNAQGRERVREIEEELSALKAVSEELLGEIVEMRQLLHRGQGSPGPTEAE